MTPRLSTLSGAVALALATACATSPRPPILRPGQAIAVLPPNNRTAAPLLVAGASFLDHYVFHAERVTVGDVLAAEARFQLAERGIAVIPQAALVHAIDGQVPQSPGAAAEIAARGKLDALALYVEIRHWEPDAATHPAFVIVGASASLVDPASGAVVWRLDRPSAPIATPGEVTLEAAYETAARKLASEIVSRFGP
jgi:hypothetical protein